MSRHRPSADSASMASAASDLSVALQVRYPQVRSVLISGLNCPGSDGLGRTLVHVMSRTEPSSIGLQVDASGGVLLGPPGSSVKQEQEMTLESAREMVGAATRDHFLVSTTEDFVAQRESMLLAAVVDGIILLAQAGRTTERALDRARQRINDASGTLLGGVYVR